MSNPDRIDVATRRVGRICGRLRRREGEDAADALERARDLPWAKPRMTVDGRGHRYWVFRVAEEGPL